MSAAPAAPPARPHPTDRFPFDRQIALLTTRGHWRAMDAIAREHGWHSPELRAFIDAHLPTAPCAICGTPFYAHSRRVKYCSDACRREATRLPGGVPPSPHAPVPAPLPPDTGAGVHLVRRGGSTARHYTARLVEEGGRVALHRAWWGERTTWGAGGTVRTYPDREAALAALAKALRQLRQAGYRETPEPPARPWRAVAR